MAVIEHTKGDILEADAEALVNTVNCVGVMGRGIALQFKHAYPANFKEYAAACKRGDIQPGRMLIHDTGQLQPRWIVNFPTKRHWRDRSRLEDIRSGMDALVHEIRTRDIHSIAIPPLGSGLGGLDWPIVRRVIEDALAAVPDVQVLLFEPTPDAARARAPQRQDSLRMTAGRAALVGLIQRYLRGMMEPSISLLEVHKLMYFLQAAGEPLRLRYVKAFYGPYAENLRHVLSEVEGHLTHGYSGEGDAPNEQLELLPGAVDKAEAFLIDHDATRERFERVASLADGFETPYGLELLATAHWVATKERAATTDDIVTAIYAWGPGKNQFSRPQITLAVQRLTNGAWVEAH